MILSKRGSDIDVWQAEFARGSHFPTTGEGLIPENTDRVYFASVD